MAGPKLPDLNSLIQAGINPKTGLPIKMGPTACMLKENLKKNFRIMDEQNAINRYITQLKSIPSSGGGLRLTMMSFFFRRSSCVSAQIATRHGLMAGASRITATPGVAALLAGCGVRQASNTEASGGCPPFGALK